MKDQIKFMKKVGFKQVSKSVFKKDEKSQQMLSYIMQYRRSQERFDKLCKVKCERDGDVVELKNLMYVFSFLKIFLFF